MAAVDVLAASSEQGRSDATERDREPARSIWVSGALGAALAALLIGVLAYGAGRLGPAAVPAFTTSYNYRTLDDPLELLLVQSDGQAFASLARDPALQRPEVFRTRGEMAYRAQRPLFGYAAWMLSLGRSGWVPPALAVLAALGAGLATSGVGRLLVDRGASPYLSLLVLLLPGTYMALSYCGPEPFGLGLLAWGLVWWGRRRLLPAVALFAVAGLCRETLLAVPAALVVVAIVRRDRKSAMLGVLAALPYFFWIGLLRLRVGAYPWDAPNGRLAAPFVGIWSGLSNSTASGTTTYALITAAMFLAAIVFVRFDRLLATAVLGHLPLALIMGDGVWITWSAFGRLLLPVHAFVLTIVIARVRSRPVAVGVS